MYNLANNTHNIDTRGSHIVCKNIQRTNKVRQTDNKITQMEMDRKTNCTTATLICSTDNQNRGTRRDLLG